MITPDSSELSLRWEKCRTLMLEKQIDLCIVSTPVNIYYLLGRIINGYVVLTHEGLPFVFVRRPSGLTGDRITYFRKPEEMPAVLASDGGGSVLSVAVEQDSLPYSECLRLHHCFAGATLQSSDWVLRMARAVKTPFEIGQMRQCGRVHQSAYAAIPDLYRPGMTDHAFAIEFEHFMRRLGHIGIFRSFGAKMESFMGSSILIGDNADAASPYDFALGGAGMSPALPVGDNGTVLRPGQTMMVDGGGCFGAYMTDMTRVYALGTLPELALRAHQCSLDIHQWVRLHARPGVSCADLYQAALQMVHEAGLDDYFMGHLQQAAFVGHGVGLQINELPVLFGRSKDILAENMVIALEPKFVIPGVGAVGNENTYVIGSNGVECLTDTPDQITYLD